MKKLISCAVPCFNEEQALPIMYRRLAAVADGFSGADFEFIFVNDGSTDGTLAVLRGLALQDPRARYISFSRNFGKEAAMLAGLRAARGDYGVILDADLQDPPELLPEMFEMLETGKCDCVNLYRENRKGEGRLRSALSRAFYRLMGRVTGLHMISGARDCRMMTRRVIDSVLSLPEYNRFTKGIFGWVGYETRWLGYENVERVAGETKFTLGKLFRYAVEGIVSFSTVPLTAVSALGGAMCVVALIMALFYGVKALIFGDPVAGFPTLICVVLLVGGIQLLCTGVVGAYVAKTYMETKRRPPYFVRETEADTRPVAAKESIPEGSRTE